MGYRIELEEIENTINEMNNVIQCGVIYYRKQNSNYGKIVAFIQAENNILEKQIKESISNKLPSYMIPNKIVILNKLPKNQNGKVDRNKLKEMIK
jgi:D-alanine--poly(phosphoribitol) ligase subunit 1